MQETQDGLTALAILRRAESHTRQSVDSAEKVLGLADARYQGGIGIHLDVITAQQAVLSRKRQLTQLHGQQLQASVFLIKAIGGAW
jgi:outer membrane protein TolC